jgi:deoxyadenosine/deoxycytidine kinase
MLIAIAGNIGSGKTTLAKQLVHHLNFEPDFEEYIDNPYIADFYKEMERWSFNLQIHFLNARLTQLNNVQRSGKNVVQDRTIYEDAEIFAYNLLTMGYMSQRDYQTYKSLYDTVIHLIQPPDLVIYLKASISTLVDQIASRGRDYEDNIRIDYLKRLNERYDNWFKDYSLGKKIEVSVDDLKFNENPEHFGTILRQVQGELFGLFQ